MDAEDGLPQCQPVGLESLCADLGEPFGILAEQKGVELAVACDPDLAVQGDPAAA